MKNIYTLFLFLLIFTFFFYLLEIFSQYIMNILIDKYELKQTDQFKNIINANNILGIFHYY